MFSDDNERRIANMTKIFRVNIRDLSNANLNNTDKINFLDRILLLPTASYLFIVIFFGTFFGPFGALIISYIFTNEFTEALQKTTILYFNEIMKTWQNILGLCFLQAILFYLLYMQRYMKHKIEKSKPSFVELLVNGEEDYNDIFSNITKPLTPILITLVFMVLYASQAIPEASFTIFSVNRITQVFLIFSFSFWFLTFTIFAWIYLGSIRGLYLMGKKEIKLKPFRVDKMLGVRPVSSFSLAFAFTYFTGLSLLALVPMITSVTKSSYSFYFVVSISSLLGLFIFFLPLYSFHLQMRAYKEREKQRLTSILLESSKNKATKNDPNSIAEIKESIDRLSSILQTDIIRDELEKIPIWPIDIPIIGRLATIMVSIFTIILANYIMKRILYL